MRRFLIEDLNPYKQNNQAQQIAQEYCLSQGYPGPFQTKYEKVNELVAKRIAEYFEQTPSQPNNPAVRQAYNALIHEVNLQFEMLPVQIEAFGDGFTPYKDSPEMMDDVLVRKHLWVYDGGTDHAMLTREENFFFRAVHDYFGHCQYGFAFGPRGEFNAFCEHCKMFGPIARQAMAAETRGQNSWVNYGPHSHLGVLERPYAEQKALILPFEWCSTPELQEAYREFPGFFPPGRAENPRR